MHVNNNKKQTPARCASYPAYLGAVVLIKAGGRGVPLSTRAALLSGCQALRCQAATAVAASTSAEASGEASRQVLGEGATAAGTEAPGDASCAAKVLVTAGANNRFLQDGSQQNNTM
jgi:hypothetical protein